MQCPSLFVRIYSRWQREEQVWLTNDSNVFLYKFLPVCLSVCLCLSFFLSFFLSSFFSFLSFFRFDEQNPFYCHLILGESCPVSSILNITCPLQFVFAPTEWNLHKRRVPPRRTYLSNFRKINGSPLGEIFARALLDLKKFEAWVTSCSLAARVVSERPN